MPNTDIRGALANAIAYLNAHPDEARYTDSPATAVLESGLAVTVHGPQGMSIHTDMPKSVGGTDQSPSPGWLLRAAQASCLATLVAMRAAQQGLEPGRIEVVVDSESDDRGILGIDDSVPAGPMSSRHSSGGPTRTAPYRMRSGGRFRARSRPTIRKSRLGDSNPGPMVYETIALPLS